MTMKNEKCKDLVKSRLGGHIKDLKKLFEAYQKRKKDFIDALGTFNEYSLGFDYVPAFTGSQTAGYFRYQLSWGSDEFRYYTDVLCSLERIEYWFDGVSITLSKTDYDLMSEIFEFFKEVGCAQATN